MDGRRSGQRAAETGARSGGVRRDVPRGRRAGWRDAPCAAPSRRGVPRDDQRPRGQHGRVVHQVQFPAERRRSPGAVDPLRDSRGIPGRAPALWRRG